jgi:ABC-type branched-subunit amino acid transport system ATPase component
MSVCDRVLVLDYGRKIAEGHRRHVQKDRSDRRVSRRRDAPQSEGAA